MLSVDYVKYFLHTTFQTGEGRTQGTTVMDHGHCSGRRTTGVTPEGRDQILYKNERFKKLKKEQIHNFVY